MKDDGKKPVSKSYKSDWGMDCFKLGDKPHEPCWGKVLTMDDGVRQNEDGSYYEVNAVYACEGHYEWPYRDYVPEGEA
jgi:hypothetical protein